MEKGGDLMSKNQRTVILQFIEVYISSHGYGPSIREICSGTGLNSTATVHYHLNRLAESGSIVLEPGKKRAISLPPDTKAKDRSGESERSLVPVLGAVAAGQPILAVENVEGWLPWEAGEGWFALRVKGESMKNAGILPGDKVVVRPQPTAEPGEIVVALLGDEATVKRFSRRGGHVWLLPENEAFEPIDGSESVILGVVRGVVREYG
jgi:repressor LexA